MLALKSGPQIAAKVGNPAGLLCRRIWYSVGKSGVLGITEYRQGRPLLQLYGMAWSMMGMTADTTEPKAWWVWPMTRQSLKHDWYDRWHDRA